MKELVLNGIFLLNGEPDFRKQDFAGLTVGDRVSAIGAPGRNGKVTSGSRVDRWMPYVTYVGKMLYEWPGVPGAIDNLCFLLPPGGIVPDQGPCYVLYIVIEYQGEVSLMRNAYNKKGSDVKLFKAKFTTV